MRLKICLISLVFLFGCSTITGQNYQSLEKKSADVLISLSKNDSGYKTTIEELKSVLFEDIDGEILEGTYLITPAAFDSLKYHFSQFQKESENISPDSSLVLFNNWYLHLQNLFYDYNKEKFFSSNKTKILFFSASMSCQCTLEMCRKQTIEILKLAKEKNLDYWIVDSYEHNDLQIKYETFFAPSLVLFDGNNNVLTKIEYDENMIAQLDNYLKK
ncbi:MAG TPA: hypothetical protein PKA80_06960 [Ignavibacteriaceae bacterium]|nr:hypothetical protein [Ignavibacteriaceae bacterium]